MTSLCRAYAKIGALVVASWILIFAADAVLCMVTR